MKTERIAQNSNGFTLIEILITLSIISLLTAIAIPQYSAYKKQAFDMRALSDLRNVAIAEEAYFMQTEKYISCTANSCSGLPGISRISKGVEISVNASDQSFTAKSSHSSGSGKQFTWDSLKGGLQE